MTDPISDLLARIRNAQTARHESLTVPHSILKLGIVKLLSQEGFVGPFQVTEGKEGGRKEIRIALRYIASKEPMISSLTRTSRPGRRVYVSFRNLKPVRNGIGVAVLSTPKGILTDRQAKEMKLGGEILFTVW